MTKEEYLKILKDSFKDFKFYEVDLCDKEVININNCCYIGHVRDMEFDECSGCICAIIVPGPGKYMGCNAEDQNCRAG